ncbi:uncharacterized protein cubi_01589 [Cryptosporidium ubiquitum]|uniref:Uncharacterized protein n=1 Tax=Cryptosporidium ubiquitum TaxID=857276 RepID=A0A1J4MDE6_9CRYT|nr:uncharacterized protein cubi_01589 [Cryptosporidium ubiquitum]OII72256.1 hypothetical protein cubi_01589 [Cryptosporidium ubiquitum]
MIGIRDSNISSTDNYNDNNNNNRTLYANSRVSSQREIGTDFQDGNLSLSEQIGSKDDSSGFQVSIGFCYNKEAENLKKLKVKESLIKLSGFTDLFLFVQVDTDEDEKVITNYMEEFGIFKAGLKKHRLVFCEKLESISFMARQLQANMHIDTNQDNEQRLLNKVPNISILSLDDDGSSLFELVETIEKVTTKQ